MCKAKGCNGTSLTETASELSVDDDVGVSPDGGGEVSVARDVESIVLKLLLLLHSPGAEIASQLHETVHLSV